MRCEKFCKVSYHELLHIKPRTNSHKKRDKENRGRTGREREREGHRLLGSLYQVFLIKERRAQRELMEDFYLTIPYGLLVLAGGIIGYVKRRSTASLAAGIGFGGLLLAAGFASLRAFQTHSISYLAPTLETGTI